MGIIDWFLLAIEPLIIASWETWLILSLGFVVAYWLLRVLWNAPWPWRQIEGVKKFHVRVDKTGHKEFISIHRDDLPQDLRTGDGVVVYAKTGRKVRGKVYRRHQYVDPGVIEMTETKIDRLIKGHRGETELDLELRIAPLSAYTPGDLWNHPDFPTQLSVRLTLILTVITTVLSVLIEVWSSYYL